MAGSGNAHLRQAAELLKIQNLKVEFATPKGKTEIISDFSIDVGDSEVLGVVGESGCGKSTLAKTIVQINKAKSGSILFEGNDIVALSKTQAKLISKEIQMIFQDPISSLNPAKKIRNIISEPLKIHKVAFDERSINETLSKVGLDANIVLDRKPRQFSGGQCQRISIARALGLSPKLLICDEPVSALDVSIQAQILNLLIDIKDEFKMSMLFISHDLSVIKYIADRIAVMYLGKLCEVGSTDQVILKSSHPYTQALVDSVLDVNSGSSIKTRHKIELKGEIPSFTKPPSGCRFRLRCPFAQPICEQDEPQIRKVGEDHFVACHFPIMQNG